MWHFDVVDPGRRTRCLTIVMTLVDVEAYSRDNVAKLYGFRRKNRAGYLFDQAIAGAGACALEVVRDGWARTLGDAAGIQSHLMTAARTPAETDQLLGDLPIHRRLVQSAHQPTIDLLHADDSSP